MVRFTLDQNDVLKEGFFTEANSDTTIDGLNAGASQGKTFDSRLIPAGANSGISTLDFTRTSSALTFPKSGHSYLVTVSLQTDDSFVPVPLATQVNASVPSVWEMECCRTTGSTITWNVHVPNTNNYGPVQMTVRFLVVGIWTAPNNLSPGFAFSQPVLIN